MNFIKDPKTGEQSVTLTMLVVGFSVSLLKLLTSGMIYGSINLGTFSGADFAEVVGALGAIYAARKHSDNITINNTDIKEVNK